MGHTPGSTARDSRSLSVEAARYDAEAIEIDATATNTEAQIRKLEAQLKAAREKAEKVRLLKHQTEAAREEAFQKEREERQAEVRSGINDHVVEGVIRKLGKGKATAMAMAMCQTDDTVNDQAYQQSNVQELSHAVLNELAGDVTVYLEDVAFKILEQSESVGVTGLSTVQQLTWPSASLTPSKPLRDPGMSDHRALTPPLQPYESLASPGVAVEEIPEIDGVNLEELHDINSTEAAVHVVEGRIPSDTDCQTGEDRLEEPGTTGEKDTVKNNPLDTDEQEHRTGRDLMVATRVVPPHVVELDNEEDSFMVQEPTEAEEVIWTNSGSTRTDHATDPMTDVSYTIEEQEQEEEQETIERGDVDDVEGTPVVFKEEPNTSFDALASAVKRKRQSTVNFFDSDTPSTTPANFRRRDSIATEADEHIFSVPQTSQPAAPIPKKAYPGLNTPALPTVTPANKKANEGKRERQESEASTTIDGDEVTVTPVAKKSKANIKNDNTVPKRVADFVKSVKAMTSTNQAGATLCSICGQLPTSPRLSSCLHMYCEKCWKRSAKQSGTTKFTKQPRGRNGCQGHLGKAVVVPPALNILDMRGELWTGVKNTRVGKGGLDEGAMDIDEDDFITVEHE